MSRPRRTSRRCPRRPALVDRARPLGRVALDPVSVAANRGVVDQVGEAPQVDSDGERYWLRPGATSLGRGPLGPARTEAGRDTDADRTRHSRPTEPAVAS